MKYHPLKFRMAMVGAVACVSFHAVPAKAQFGVERPSEAEIAKEKALPTPRAPDGHPDLTGYWGGVEAPGEKKVSADGKTIELQIPTPKTLIRQRAASGNAENFGPPGRSSSQPEYKPEFLPKIKALHEDATDLDPSYRCMPEGLPRIGPPAEIFQSAKAVALIYANNDFARVIPTDGAAHDKNADPSYFGNSVGHWEGNTLVLDATRFNDLSWFTAEQGYFHTDALHVVERLTREGNTIHYEAIVEDPNVLTKPWVITPRTLRAGKPDQHVIEDPPCIEMDQSHLIEKYHVAP